MGDFPVFCLSEDVDVARCRELDASDTYIVVHLTFGCKTEYNVFITCILLETFKQDISLRLSSYIDSLAGFEKIHPLVVDECELLCRDVLCEEAVPGDVLRSVMLYVDDGVVIRHLAVSDGDVHYFVLWSNRLFASGKDRCYCCNKAAEYNVSQFHVRYALKDWTAARCVRLGEDVVCVLSDICRDCRLIVFLYLEKVE